MAFITGPQRNLTPPPLTFTELSDLYGGEEEVSDADRVLSHKDAVVRDTVEHNALGVLHQTTQIWVL